MRRFARATLFDDAAIDDLSQDTLISVASSIGSFKGGSAITTWAPHCPHRVVDHFRRRRTTSALPPDDLATAARISSMIATRDSIRPTYLSKF